VNNHASHERTYIPFTPFAALNDAAPIRLLYFNGTGGPVPNHYALLVPCSAENTRLNDMVMQARAHVFERITIGHVGPVGPIGPIGPSSPSSSGSFENSDPDPIVSAARFDVFGLNNNDDDVEFDELKKYDFEVPKMPFCNNSDDPVPAAPAPDTPVVVVDDEDVVVEPPPAKKKTREGSTRKGRSYYTAFEDNMAHGHDRLISDVMAKAEVACRTCGCPKCAAVSNHENAFEMFICKPTSPAEACQLRKVWSLYRRR
jgi:hypothetical protein